MTSMLITLEESAGAQPWYYGGAVLVIFLALIIAALIIGKGREHT